MAKINKITLEGISYDLVDIESRSLITETEQNLREELDTKQDTLISGSNIKTVNGLSLVGSGNIDLGNLSGSSSADAAPIASTLNFTTTEDSVVMGGNTLGGESIEVEVPVATIESAGVMSAEDKSKLDGFDDKITPITGVFLEKFSGNGTQNSEVTHHLVAGKKYTITAILKQYNESYPVYIQFINRSDDSIAFSGLILNNTTPEAVKEFTLTKDIDIYVRYYTGYTDSIAEVRIESVSELEETKSTAELVWDSVLNLSNRIDNNFISLTGVLSKTTKDISVFTLNGSLFKKIKAYVGADTPSASCIAFYNSETISAETLISNITSKNGVLWVEADVPEACKLIAVANMNDILAEPQIIGATNAAKGIMDTRENVSANTNTLKAFDPQQTLLCSNYLYTNTGAENALSLITYLWEQDNETIKGASITGMIFNVLGTGTLSLYLAKNVELETRVETLVEEISVTQLGVQVIRFSNPIVVGADQTFGFKMGFKHAVSTTYKPTGFMGVRYVYNGVFTSSNKDFGFGLVGMKKFDDVKDKYPVTRGILGSFVNRINPYYDHLFIDKINKGVANDDIIIPSESIYSVAISKRLGFDMLELNVNYTSDGAFLVFHGDGGKFGSQFEHIDGVTNISAVAVNSVTSEWVKSNVRYKSKYPKYRTAPSTLKEMLHECKRNGIVPFVQRKDTNATGTWVSSITSADRIMGRDNYVSYGGGNNRETSAPICYFGSESSLEAILAVCNKYGAPFIYAINNVTRFSDDELKNIVDTLHYRGYFVGFAGSYQNEPLNQKLLNMGFDISASGWNVPIFTDSNIMCADSFDQFAHNGTVNDGELTLSAGNTVSIAHSGSVPFLSVGLLQIRFTGKLNIKMGDYINNEFVSDGDSAMTLTTYYMEKAPVFNITAVEGTVIKEILFKASKR